MNGEKLWYAVYTRPKWEKKVSGLLSQKNVENYCPFNKTTRQWADRKKIIYEPLFSSYVFVHIDQVDRLTIQETKGVLNFVYWLGRPAVIKNAEIEAIRHFLHYHDDVKLEKIKVNVADRVRIMDGPLMYREGNVLEVKNHSVKVCLPSLGCVMMAEVPKRSIEILNTTSEAVTDVERCRN